VVLPEDWVIDGAATAALRTQRASVPVTTADDGAALGA
jgi:hypothetical protein